MIGLFSLVRGSAVSPLARTGFGRAVGQYRVKPNQRIASDTNKRIGGASEARAGTLRRGLRRGGGSAAATLRLGHAPSGAADRTPRTLRRLIGSVRRFCGRRGPYVGFAAVLATEGLLDLATELVAHVARA